MAKKRDVPKVVEAQAFVLRDAKGKTRAQLFVDGEYGPVLWFLDSKEQVRLEIQLDRGRPIMRFIGNDQQPALGFGTDENGGGGITIYHANGMPAFMIGTRSLDNTVSASISDKSGKVLWRSSVVLPDEVPTK